MKKQQWLWMLTFVLTLGSVSVYGQCLVQETTVFYVNGVDNTEQDAKDSAKKLKSELFVDSDVKADCVSVRYAYNNNEPLELDILEAAVQKTNELYLDLPFYWRLFYRLTDVAGIPAWFDATMNMSLAGVKSAEYVIDNQLQAHLKLYREELAQRRQVILVSHSQGNFYTNEAWKAMTPREQSETFIVSVATPADRVESDGRYTTLDEDGIAAFFAFALPANASNEEECPGMWYCHGFREWYLTGQRSHDSIIHNIVRLLPAQLPPLLPELCAVKGTIYDTNLRKPAPNGRGVLRSNTSPFDVIAEYATNANGRYCIPFLHKRNGMYQFEVYVGDVLIEDVSMQIFLDRAITIDFPIPRMM